MILNILTLGFMLIYRIEAIKVIYGHEDPTYNMVRNWDFSSELSTSDWIIQRGDVARLSSQEASKQGPWGIKVYNRTHKDGGVLQTIYFGSANPKLKLGKPLYFSAFIKFDNNATLPEHYIRAKYMYRFKYQDNSMNYQGSVGRLSYEFADGLWNQIGGDLAGPPIEYPTPISIEIFMRVEPVSINYYLDTFALTRIKELGETWKTKLSFKVNQFRKSNVQISTPIPEGIDVNNTHIIIEMERPLFNWGTSLPGGFMSGTTQLQNNLKDYLKRVFYKNWITFTAAMNWGQMEETKNAIRYQPVSNDIQWLLNNGFKVRGHSLLWEIAETNPSWVRKLSGFNLKSNIMRRIDYATTWWKNQIYEWDVCNEFLHNHFYEDLTRQRDLSLLAEEFRLARDRDPAAKLCISDYSVLRDGQYTSAQANLAMKLRDHMQAPIDCLGAQSHMRLKEDFSIDRYLKRLQILAAANMPISISELSVHTSNITKRAAILEQIMHALYSEKQVSGAIFWSLGDRDGLKFENDTALVEGIDFVPNEAGQIMENLLLSQWTSYANYRPTSRNYVKAFKFYHGMYKMTLYVNKEVHAMRRFEVWPTRRVTFSF